MRFLHLLFITSSTLLLFSCSSKSEVPHLETSIVGKWQGTNESRINDSDNTVTKNPHSMQFLPSGKILWDMTTQENTLRLAGNYKFIDHNTIQVDFIRYSNRSTIWDVSYSSSSPPQESITIRDSNANDIIATMERVY